MEKLLTLTIGGGNSTFWLFIIVSTNPRLQPEWKNAKVNVVDKVSIGVTSRWEICWESSLNGSYARLVNNNKFSCDISRVYWSRG